jgi:hypothetical protein
VTALRAYLDRVWEEALAAFAKAAHAAPTDPEQGGPMSSAPTIPPLTGTITVDAPIDQALRSFTEHFGSWWPAEYHRGPLHRRRTRPDHVQLEHRNLERLVDGQALRDGIVGGGGWPSLLELFAKAATNQR